jgi:hypothetical protein
VHAETRRGKLIAWDAGFDPQDRDNKSSRPEAMIASGRLPFQAPGTGHGAAIDRFLPLANPAAINLELSQKPV